MNNECECSLKFGRCVRRNNCERNFHQRFICIRTHLKSLYILKKKRSQYKRKKKRINDEDEYEYPKIHTHICCLFVVLSLI